MKYLLIFLIVTVGLSSCGGGGGEEVVRPAITKGRPGVSVAQRKNRFKKLLVSHPLQNRPSMVESKRLTRAAQKRAADMARRGYFGHVDPDGKGPNYHVAKAGYRLPRGWTAFPKTNYVESILAGPGTAAEAMKMWLGSTQHRYHLLAKDHFYRKQTKYGIGHVSVPGSPMRNYWVFISAPPEKADN